MKYRRAPRSLGAAMESLADDLAPQTLLGDVQRAWPAVVGGPITEQAEPTADLLVPSAGSESEFTEKGFSNMCKKLCLAVGAVIVGLVVIAVSPRL